MWFIFSLLTAFAWGAANLFYKKGSKTEDRQSHLKIVTMVGFTRGIHAILYMIIKAVDFNPFDIIRYLQVSAMYIFSMTIGYFGLRYIELSIAALVLNSARAVSVTLFFILFQIEMISTDLVGIIVVTVGAMTLAVFEKQNATYVWKESNQVIDPKDHLSVLAVTFPRLYALIDGIATFADGI